MQSYSHSACTALDELRSIPTAGSQLSPLRIGPFALSVHFSALSMFLDKNAPANHSYT